MTTTAVGHFVVMRRVRKVGMWKKRRRQAYRDNLPWRGAAIVKALHGMAVGANSPLEEILGDTHRLDTGLGRCTIAVLAAQVFPGPSQSPRIVLSVLAQQTRTVVFDQYLYDAFCIPVWNHTFWVLGIKAQCMTAAAMLVHGNRLHPGTARFGLVTIDAVQHLPSIGADDATGIQVNLVVEVQV